MRHRMLRAAVLAGATAVAALPLAGAATAAPSPVLFGTSPQVNPAVQERPAPPHRAADVVASGVRLHAEQSSGPGPQIATLGQRDVITAVRCVDIVPGANFNWVHVDVAGKPSGEVSSEFLRMWDSGPQCYQPAPTPVM